MDKLPAESAADAATVYQEILKGAPASIAELTNRLLVPGKVDDSKVRLALHGLAIYVYRPGAEAERKVFAETLAKQLDSKLAPAVKGFLIRQLQFAAGPEAIAAIGGALGSDELCEYAAQALLAMKDKRTIEQFRRALPGAKGGCRLTIIQALGVLGAAKSIPAVTAALGDKDRDLRLAAAFALANSADPDAVEPLLKAADAEAAYERSQMTDAALLLARRLGGAGEKRGAERIGRHLIKTRTGDDDLHVRCAALMALAQALGADVMDDVLAAMGSDEPDLRAAGIAAAIAMPGEEATQRWVERMKKASPAGRIAILDLLARRGDTAALPAVLEAIADPDEKVRLAAMAAAGSTGDGRAVGPLARALASQSAVERQAARNALLSIQGKAVTATIAKALSTASPEIRVGLLEILAARKGREQFDVILSFTKDADARVRAAAMASLGKLAEAKDLPTLIRFVVGAKEAAVTASAEKALNGACRRLGDKDQCVAALAGALAGAQGPARAAMLRVLGSIGNQAAFKVVRAGLSDQDAGVQDAAIRALSDWPDDSPTADLLRIVKTAAKPTHQVLALRGYVRMIPVRKDRSVAERLGMCREAMAVARRDEERRLVLAEVGNVPTPDALKMAEASLGNAALKDEAAIAVVKIAKGISGGNRELAKEAIAKATAATDHQEVHKQAKDAIDFIERNEDFITAWMVSGPYKGGKTSIQHPPEKPDAKDVKWKLVAATGTQPGFVDLNRELGNIGDCAGYLRAQIWSPKDQEARLEIGTDDGVKVWLGGQVVHDKDVPRSFALNEDKVKVALKQGWNQLLVKVVQGSGDWSGCVRIRTADGGKLEGIRLKAE